MTRQRQGYSSDRRRWLALARPQQRPASTGTDRSASRAPACLSRPVRNTWSKPLNTAASFAAAPWPFGDLRGAALHMADRILPHRSERSLGLLRILCGALSSDDRHQPARPRGRLRTTECLHPALPGTRLGVRPGCRHRHGRSSRGAWLPSLDRASTSSRMTR